MLRDSYEPMLFRLKLAKRRKQPATPAGDALWRPEHRYRPSLYGPAPCQMQRTWGWPARLFEQLSPKQNQILLRSWLSSSFFSVMRSGGARIFVLKPIDTSSI